METIQYPTETKARKEHRCDFCCEMILIGGTYLKSVYKFDGTVYSWKTHDYCQKIANKLDMYKHCDDGVGTEDFQETINNVHNSICGDANTLEFKDRLYFVLAYNGIDI